LLLSTVEFDRTHIFMFNPFRRAAPEEKEQREAQMRTGNESARADLLWKNGARLLARKKNQRAVEVMRQALELEPTRLEGRLNLGAALFLTGQHEEAIGHFRYVLAFDPQSTMALLNLAASLDALGRLEESVETLQLLVERRPAWRDAHYNLGVGLYKLKKYPAAEDALRAELQLNPEHELARELLNTIYRLPHISDEERQARAALHSELHEGTNDDL
jgi:tetratricopeptide (TPR) repeat protein